jgi:hypothetical protein
MSNSQSTPSPIISVERPDSSDALALIDELEIHLASLYPAASRHGFSSERLVAEAVPFFVLRVGGRPAGCGGIKLFGRKYAELTDVRPPRLSRKRLRQIDLGPPGPVRPIINPPSSYENAGFYRIPPFGPYTNDPLSLCYQKPLVPRLSSFM